MSLAHSNYLAAVLLFATTLCPSPPHAHAQQPGRIPPDVQSSRDLVLEVIARARELGLPGDPDGVASEAVVPEIIRLGDAALPGALSILEARSEEAAVLSPLLRATVQLAGLGDSRVCSLVRGILASAADGEEAVPVWTALEVLRTRTGACHEAIEEVAGLYRNEADRAVRLETIELLGWLGRTPDDYELVLTLGRRASDECERRLIAAAGLRILDRLMPGGT